MAEPCRRSQPIVRDRGGRGAWAADEDGNSQTLTLSPALTRKLTQSLIGLFVHGEPAKTPKDD